MTQKEPTPPAPGPERDDSLEDFEVPPLQLLALRATVLVISFFTRVADVLVLLWRPRLLRAYVGIWLAEWLYSPYRWRKTFETVRALRASGQKFRELVYGETPVVTGLWFFRRAGVGKGSRLVDLGAGRGRALIAARWWGAEVRGVDLLASHVATVAGQLRPAGIELTVGDALQEDLGDATHVYVAWTALSPETKARFVEHFRTCRPGTRFVTVTRPIEAQGFVLLSRHWVLFTWGFESVWIHEYRPQV